MAGLRERKMQQTRDRIEETALELFAAAGYDETTVETICLQAEVSPATFYRYFGSKEQLILQRRRELDAMLRRAISETPVGQRLADDLQPILERFAALVDTDAARVRMHDGIVAGDPALLRSLSYTLDEWERQLCEGLMARHKRDAGDVSAELAAGVGMAVVRTSWRRWRTAPERSLRSLVTECSALLVEICADHGRGAGVAAS